MTYNSLKPQCNYMQLNNTTFDYPEYAVYFSVQI
jgi:hypothetical protein